MNSRAILAPLPYGQTECGAVNKDKGEMHTQSTGVPHCSLYKVRKLKMNQGGPLPVQTVENLGGMHLNTICL